MKANGVATSEVRLLIAGSLEAGVIQSLVWVLRKLLGGKTEVESVSCQTMAELEVVLPEHSFDMAILHLYTVDGPSFEEVQRSGELSSWLGPSTAVAPRLIAHEGRAMIGYLAKDLVLPVLVLNSCRLDHDLIRACGALASLEMPCGAADLEAAFQCCLKL